MGRGRWPYPCPRSHARIWIYSYNMESKQHCAHCMDNMTWSCPVSGPRPASGYAARRTLYAVMTLRCDATSMLGMLVDPPTLATQLTRPASASYPRTRSSSRPPQARP